MILNTLLTCSLLFGVSFGAAPIQALKARQTTTPDPFACPDPAICASVPIENSNTTRKCWNGVCGRTETIPTTNVQIRNYTLEISDALLAPDGVSRNMMVINGQYPGPVLTANWGDTFQITVKNSLKTSGTSLHWHGVNQVNSSVMDGANGVTECPIEPGATRVYTFKATSHGTSWYHSHYSAQYGDGVLGTIQIDGPATEDYDVDLGTFPVTDWYYSSMAVLAPNAQGPPPRPENALINGLMKDPTQKLGQYANVVIEKGKRYRLRLINTSVENQFRVSLDGHPFKVIAADFVPIESYTANWLFVGIGERYDVVFTASQDASNYWFRAEVDRGFGCGTNGNNGAQGQGNILAVFQYQGAPVGLPTNNITTTYTTSCRDETGLVPWVKKDVDPTLFDYPTWNVRGNLTIQNITPNPKSSYFVWTVDDSSINVDWSQPTLKYLADAAKNHTAVPPLPSSLNIHEIPEKDLQTFWIIQNAGILPHPIHLHGHDFFLFGTSPAGVTKQTPFTQADVANLTFTNPTRRDVAMLPPNGWMVIGFVTDNPGAWLLHCHIAWHVSDGLAVQFLERANDIIDGRMDLSLIDGQCVSWSTYQATQTPRPDSGLRRF